MVKTNKPEKIEPGSTEEAEINKQEEVEQSEKEVPEPKPEPKQTAPKPDKINAVVKCCFIETRDGISAKRGETIEIPTDPEKHSPALAGAIRDGTVVIDLAPVVSKDTE